MLYWRKKTLLSIDDKNFTQMPYSNKHSYTNYIFKCQDLIWFKYLNCDVILKMQTEISQKSILGNIKLKIGILIKNYFIYLL